MDTETDFVEPALEAVEPKPGGEQPGPIFDTSMRGVMAGALLSACAALDVPIGPGTRTIDGAFPTTTLATDLLLADGETHVVHIEYESRPRPVIIARMLIYRGMIMRDHPRCQVDQYVIVLGDTRVTKVRGWPWSLPFRVIYLRELNAERFLTEPALAPLAVLAKGTPDQRRAAFTRALELIRSRGGDRVKELVDQASALATIRLDRPTINQIIEEAGMTVESIVEFYRETVIGQALKDAGRQEGREEGREEGLEAAMSALLTARFGDDVRIPSVASRLAGLAPDEAVREITQVTSLDELAERV